MWYVYIVRCSDNSLYTGLARDIERRIDEHNHSDASGARYTRGRRPVTLVYQEAFDLRSDAAKREFEIKRLTRKAKESLISG